MKRLLRQHTDNGINSYEKRKKVGKFIVSICAVLVVFSTLITFFGNFNVVYADDEYHPEPKFYLLPEQVDSGKLLQNKAADIFSKTLEQIKTYKSVRGKPIYKTENGKTELDETWKTKQDTINTYMEEYVAEDEFYDLYEDFDYESQATLIDSMVAVYNQWKTYDASNEGGRFTDNPYTLEVYNLISSSDLDTIECPIHGSHDLSWHHKIVYYFINNIFGKSLFDDNLIEGFIGNPYISMEALTRFDISNNETGFASLWDGAEKMYNAIAPVGIVLVAIFFLLELMEKVLQDQFSAEQLAKSFIKLASMLLVLMNGFQIITALAQVSSAIFNVIQDKDVFSSEALQDSCPVALLIDPSTGDLCSWGSSLGKMLVMLLPYLLNLLFKLIARVVVWIRVVNLLLYTMLAPVGMADMTRGLESTGFRYIKKLFSFLIQGALIYGVMAAYTIVSGAIATAATQGNTILLIISSISTSLISLTMLFRTEQLAAQLLGV